jgi:hypothetical protein
MGGLPEDAWQDISALGPDSLSCRVKSTCTWDTGSGKTGGREGVTELWLGGIAPAPISSSCKLLEDPRGLL